MFPNNISFRLTTLLRLPLLVFAVLFSTQAFALECFDADAVLPEGVDRETGFRMERYRAPVPESIPGGCIAGNNEVQAAYLKTIGNDSTDNWVFLDVFPPRGLGHDPLDGEWIISEEHSYIPGSTWLPEVGRGFLEEEHQQYFQQNLQNLTDNDTTTPVVFYCTADCWQSWNAAVRAISWGYSNVIWYPEVIDGWLEIGLELEPAIPINFFAHLDK